MPKNILFNSDGYILITGFSQAKRIDKYNKLRFLVEKCHEHYPPEMLTGEGQDETVDWWQLGILVYQMLIGITPFFEINEDDIPHSITNKSVVFPKVEEHDIEITPMAQDFILRLLDKCTSSRLGAQGFQEVLEHPFFGGIDF